MVLKNLIFILLLAMSFGQHHQRGPLRYPGSLAGIQPGKTADSEIVKLYGKGYFTSHEGHVGGRYFTDAGHSVTLHVVLGVDHIADEVEMQPGLHLPDGATASAVKHAESSKLVSGKIRVAQYKLGEAEKTILAKYGKPVSDKRSGTRREIVYKTDIDSTLDVLYYEAHFTFEHGKLIAAKLYNGE